MFERNLASIYTNIVRYECVLLKKNNQKKKFY